MHDGKLKAFHTLEIPFALDNVDESKSMTGSGADRVVIFLAPRKIEDWIGHPASIDVTRAGPALGICSRLPVFGNTPTGHSAWLALPDACLCAPMFITDRDGRSSILAAWDGTSLA